MLDILRRTRRHFKAVDHVARDAAGDKLTRGVDDILALRKRLTADEVLSLENSARASAIRAASELAASKAAATATTTTAAAATTTSTSHYAFSNKFGTSTATSTTSTTTAAAVTSTTAKTTTAATSTSTSTISSVASSAVKSSAAVSSSTSTSTLAQTTTKSSTSAAAVTTITRATSTKVATTASSSSSIASSASASVSAAAAAKSSSATSTMTNGAIAGVVVGALAGIVVLVALIGWFVRKYSKRSRSTEAPWAKIHDDDITPFPAHEKFSDDDIYGPSSAPIIGSRRALALARQNNFNEDGSLRPQSDYVANNHAGFGAGSYGAYPQLPTQYALDPQGRPYQPTAGRVPMPHVYGDVPTSSPQGYSPQNDPRQLAGPQGYPEPSLAPHSLGRPAPPQSSAQLTQLEDYDLGGPSYDAPEYTPHTATTMGEWAGDVKHPLGPTYPPMGAQAGQSSQEEVLRPLPPTPPRDEVTRSAPVNNSLPSLEPMSPFMTPFDISRRNSAHHNVFEDERSQQKRMYTEVADAAGVLEPPTPRSAGHLNDSTSTSSSFSAHDPMPSRVPSFHLDPPKPYVHGQPLSPLTELPTPLSTSTARSVQPSTRNEVNPYERTLLAAKQPVAPPYSAASTTGATGMPSPMTAPPSPGMSVPGSITDSPQRWDRRELHDSQYRSSVVDSDDAYGGI